MLLYIAVNIFLLTKMKEMPCSQFCNFRNTVFDHKSPVQPISESRGGPLSVTEQQRCRTTLLHSNI